MGQIGGDPVENTLAGTWAARITMDHVIRGTGPTWGAYEGIPLNAQARAAALDFTPDTLADLHRQCEPWSAHYLLLGPFGMQIWPTLDANGHLIAWQVSGSLDRMGVTIWMDGRPRPSSQALHTYQGFATGRWMGSTLVAVITHLKDGYLSRNGVPASNQETMTLFFTRHGDLLTLTEAIHDPVYLTASYVRSGTFQSVLGTGAGATGTTPMTCMPEEEQPGLSDGYHISTFLPGANRLASDETKLHGIPPVAAQGGAETMYPEFKQRLQGVYKQPPGYCSANCCGTNTTVDFAEKVLMCKGEAITP
jgi:hypothetical protein